MGKREGGKEAAFFIDRNRTFMAGLASDIIKDSHEVLLNVMKIQIA